MTFLEGYLAGLGLVVLIGPVLFVLLQSTLERGTAHGFSVAFGIFVSDVIAVALCAFGLAGILQKPTIQPWLALCGGLLLLGFGLRYLWAPSVENRQTEGVDALTLFGFFARGFLVNFVNPFVFLVWIGYIGFAAGRHGAGYGLVWFMSGAILAVLTLDCLKVIFAARIRPLLKPGTLRTIVRVSGVLLLGFGLRLLYYGAVRIS